MAPPASTYVPPQTGGATNVVAVAFIEGALESVGEQIAIT